METTVVRRLLLAKEFFAHGLNKSHGSGAIDKMMAVHNFHIGIEITLRAIMLHHHVRTEKTLNLEFEAMMSEIDSHGTFKGSNQKLPYRQELRNLNQLRNMVQHHAVEPELATIEDYRVFTKRFLIRAFNEYFATDFESLSRTSFVNNELLRRLIEKAEVRLAPGDTQGAIGLLALAWEYASRSISSFLPSSDPFFFLSKVRSADYGREAERIAEAISDRIREAEKMTALFASGISLLSLKRFEGLVPSVTITMGGIPFVAWKRSAPYTSDEVEWGRDFVLESVLTWQNEGLEPGVPESFSNMAKSLLDSDWPKNA
jgi:hypothetical protein